MTATLREIESLDDVRAQRGWWIRDVNGSGFFEVYLDGNWRATVGSIVDARRIADALERGS